MARMSRRVLAIVVSLVVLVAAPGALVGCGRDGSVAEEPASGFRLDADQLLVPRSGIIGYPLADRWAVEVAVVKSDVHTAILLRQPPDTKASRARRSDAAPRPPRTRMGTDSLTIVDVLLTAPDLDAEEAVLAALLLTPIPSFGLSWGSAAVDNHWEFDNPTLIGSPLVFLVVEDRGDWLRVMFPARPNHQTAWIERSDVRVIHHNWHAEVDTTANRLRV